MRRVTVGALQARQRASPGVSTNDPVSADARRPGTGTSFQLFQINVHSGHAKQLTDEAGNSFLPSVRSITRP